MMLRSFLHHVAGIGSLCLMALLLLAARILQVEGLGFLLVVIAFVPGYYGLRYLRGLSGWRTPR